MFRCGLSWHDHSWNDKIEWMAQHLKGKKHQQVLPIFCLQVAVYGLWKERNDRTFKLCFCSKEITLQKMISQVQSFIRIKWKHHSDIAHLMCVWQ